MICLKNRTFAVSQTSWYKKKRYCISLWFAWKIVLLQYHKHHIGVCSSTSLSCDLLEKSYFCSITNIKSMPIQNSRLVVICLKNRTFAVSQTSLISFFVANNSCDLLEKSYFCSITNIKQVKQTNSICVVICLKNRTFAVSQTSHNTLSNGTAELWFAWKIVLLQYHKHQTYH